MRSTTEALRRAGWRLLLPGVAWLGLWIPGLDYLVQAGIMAVFVFLAGAVGAITLPAHPLRHGTVVGVVAFLAGAALTMLAWWLLGRSPGPGWSWTSAVVELAFWLLINVPLAAIVAFFGAGAAVVLATNRQTA